MDTCPLISVVTTTFQLAGYLPQCIESVLGQTYAHIQFVLVDDASTDATPVVVSAYEDPRMQYVRLPTNKGPTAARNYGISLARGKLIAFLDADDYWLPGRLAAMLSAIRAETDLVTSDFFFEDLGVVCHGSQYCGRNLEWLFDLSSEQQFRALLEDNFLAYSMMMVPCNVLERVGVFDESLRICQDYDLWLRCVAAGSRVVCALKPLGVYRRMRSGSITSSEGERQVYERLTVLRPFLHLCSRQRSSKVRGDASNCALRRAVGSRRFLAIIRALVSLLFNPSYVWRKLRARYTPKDTLSAPGLLAFRDSLKSHA